jgi:hypothetical protein
VILLRIAGETNAGVPDDEPHDEEGLDEQTNASTLDRHDFISDLHFLASSGCVFAIFRRRVLTTAPILEILKAPKISLGLFIFKYLKRVFA